MDAKYINKNYLEETIKDYDNTIVDPIRNVVSNIYYNTADRYNDLINIINASVSGGIGLDLQLNYINSTSPVNYQSVKNVVFTTGQIGNIWCATPDKAGTQYYDWNATTKTLTFSSLTGIVTFNTDMHNTFANCSSLNQNILIPNGVTNMACTFIRCNNLNQNILIPNSVTNMDSTFAGCTSLNQNILIPNGVTDMAGTFFGCTNLNQNILLPNSDIITVQTFANCTSLNQNILIPSTAVASIIGIFQNCTSLNQNIYLYPEAITTGRTGPLMNNAFENCSLLADKYIHIRSSIPMDTSNKIYNALVNNYTGVNWTGRVINDLEEPTQWPPV